MGNHPSKEHGNSSRRQTGQSSSTTTQQIQPPPPQPTQSPSTQASNDRPSANRRRSSRHDLNIFNIGNRTDLDPSSPEARRETKAEREARKLEKERAQRAIDRERSIREEHVDGGFLVTLGTYTGTEDFSKAIVRKAMIERRLAPFWKGLNDFDTNWKDNQIAAAIKGLPIPSPQENVVHQASVGEIQRSLCTNLTPTSSSSNIAPQSIAIPQLAPSPLNDTPNLSPSHPAFSPTQSSPLANSVDSSGIQSSSAPSTKSPLFRGRAKTLAALTPFSRQSSSNEIPLIEKNLPYEPFVNGHPLESFLYREGTECPICFLFYPPYLNSTRCCDQPICSECFVQIKRPDPHPPEHHDDETNTASPPTEVQQQSSEYQLVSEVATCPFCKTPEFGITYEPPPFKRGLVYANTPNALKSAMSSSSSINSQGVLGHSRRRNTSISADSPNVITTDKVRPDWAKKLADARAQAFRRAAAATALHNAAYVIGMNEGSSSRFSLGRRRRTIFGGESDSQPVMAPIGFFPGPRSRTQVQNTRPTEAQADLFPGRASSRRSRIDDLEELMMMEAIRQSIAMEEERKRNETKDDKKDKKDEFSTNNIRAPQNWLNTPAASSASPGQTVELAANDGKGKAPAPDRNGEASTSQEHSPYSSLAASTLIPSMLSSSAPAAHLSQSSPDALRQLSMSNSSHSSFSDPERPKLSLEFGPNGSGESLDATPFKSDTPPGSASTDPLFSFRSLDEVIGDEHPTSGTQSPETAAGSSTIIEPKDSLAGANKKIPDTRVEETRLHNEV